MKNAEFWTQVGVFCSGFFSIGAVMVIYYRIKDGRFTMPITTTAVLIAFAVLVVSFLNWRALR